MVSHSRSSTWISLEGGRAALLIPTLADSYSLQRYQFCYALFRLKSQKLWTVLHEDLLCQDFWQL